MMQHKITNMNKKGWLIPILTVVANALAIIARWGSLPELLPAHYDLQGNAGGTMPRSMLLLYILIEIVICLFAYILGRMKQKLQTGLIILASGVCLVLFLSTMVTLTSGTMPIFMLAEPAILLTAIIGFVVFVVKSRKKKDAYPQGRTPRNI
jgi:uncharacterized membrane protein